MMERSRDEFYYITVMNENYAQPSMPPGASSPTSSGACIVFAPHRPAQAALAAAACWAPAPSCARSSRRLSCWRRTGTWLSRRLERDQLQRAGAGGAREVERWNRLHPLQTPRRSHVGRMPGGRTPIIAATDYVRAYPQ